MSLPPHREKDAKAGGRGTPETVTGTMAPFKNLMARLLKVPMSDVKEQQAKYEETRIKRVRKTDFQKAPKNFRERTRSPAQIINHKSRDQEDR